MRGFGLGSDARPNFSALVSMCNRTFGPSHTHARLILCVNVQAVSMTVLFTHAHPVSYIQIHAHQLTTKSRTLTLNKPTNTHTHKTETKGGF